MKKDCFFVIFVYLVFTISISYAQKQVVNQKENQQNDSIIHSLITILDTYYVLSDKGREMTNILKKQIKARAYKSILNPDELATTLEKDIKSVYPDKHLSIFYDPEFEQNLKASPSKKDKKNELDNELAYERAHNFMFTTVKILPRNIGYVQLNGFADLIEQAEPTATAAFSFLAHTNAIIVDLRFNGGGNPKMVQQVESYFFKNKTHMSDIQERFNNKTTTFYTDPAKAKGISLTMPVYILTSKRTFSGGEDFSYSMQQIKRAQIVGDTTAGGAHPTRPISFKGGFVAEIPYAQSMNPYSKKNWEGTGVIPDLPVQSSRALEKALETIYLKELAISTNDKEKRSIQWQINALKASHENSNQIDLLEKFCGEYQGGLQIYLKHGSLYCRNSERDNDIFWLVPINTHLFILDENVQAEFIEEGNQNIKLRMHFIDGNLRDKTKL